MKKIFKKGDLSMSTIVMAVIAVLIMVILVGLVMRNLGATGDVINSCTDKGGVCSYAACNDPNEGPIGYGVTNPTWACTDSTGRIDTERRCCVRG